MNNFITGLVSVLTISVFGLVTISSAASEGFLILGGILALALIIPIWKLSSHTK